jgi:hypothetical protein
MMLRLLGRPGVRKYLIKGKRSSCSLKNFFPYFVLGL